MPAIVLGGAVCSVCGVENGRAVDAGVPSGIETVCGVRYSDPMFDMAVAKALRSVEGDR